MLKKLRESVTAVADGRAGVRALLQRVAIWRVGLRWYAVALGLPVMLSLGWSA